MTKYSDTEVLYVNLSDEAEALRMRTEANDKRIESLQQRLSEVELHPQQQQPQGNGRLSLKIVKILMEHI